MSATVAGGNGSRRLTPRISAPVVPVRGVMASSTFEATVVTVGSSWC